ncbi:hypothetical protein DEO72_LG5g2158 [Vigna unguiculata]|uniref:Galectin domain-containing protein n=1 Tax=Vigna unguiculata TaxID=3917 RepID=A0A4D6LZR9_VIGUN|nr:hypothetical protein DEO72_LG5g2158 [Vigna unguiculata]
MPKALTISQLATIHGPDLRLRSTTSARGARTIRWSRQMTLFQSSKRFFSGGGSSRRSDIIPVVAAKYVRDRDEVVMVSQFMMELQGLKAVDKEEPPRILHFNPRLRGDWSGRPVIEQSTCYRMQWGSDLRCEGWKSRADKCVLTLLSSFVC